MNPESLIKTRLNLRLVAENSLYTTPQEKIDLLADDQKLADAFVFSFLGMLGVYTGATNQKSILPYFKNEKKLRPNDIGDSNNDISLIAKLLFDKKVIKTTDQMNQITKFLAKMKMGQITSIDEKYVRDWLSNMKIGFFVQNLSSEVLKIYRTYVNDPNENLERLAYRLFKIRNKFKDHAGEFIKWGTRAQFRKIPELDAEYDKTNTQTAAAPITPVIPKSAPVNVAIPVIPPKAVANNIPNFPFTEELILKTMRGERIDFSEMPSGSFYLLDGLIINDEYFNKILDEALKLKKIAKNDTAINLFWSNYSKAINRLDDDELVKYFLHILEEVNRHTKHVSSPKKLLEIFRSKKDVIVSNIKKFLDSGRSGSDVLENDQFGHLIYEINEEILKKLIDSRSLSDFDSYISDLRLFSNIFSKKEGGQLLSDLLLIHVIDEFEKAKSDNRAFKGYYSQISNVWKKFSGGVFYYQPPDVGFTDFSPTPALYEQLKNVLENFKRATTADITNTFTALLEFINNWDMIKIFGDKLEGDFALLLKQNIKKNNRELASGLIKTIPMFMGNDVLAIDTRELFGLSKTLLDPSFSDALVEEVKKHPDITSESKLAAVAYRQALYTTATSDVLRNRIEDPDKEINWYKKSIKELEITNSKDKIWIYKKVFLENMYFDPNDKEDRRKEFFLKVLNEIDSEYKNSDINVSAGQGFGADRRQIFNFLSSLDKSLTLDVVRPIVDHPNGPIAKLFSKEAFKGLKREEKTEVIEFFTNIFFDHADSNPDLIDKIYESLDPYQQGKIREKMTSFEVMGESFETGTISFLEKLTSTRIKEILSYNNINPADLVADKMPRKSKFDTFTSYNKKVKDAIAIQDIKIPEPKVTDDQLSEKDLAVRNREFIKNNYAGRHGNVYPIIKRSFSVSLPTEQYEEFTQRMKNAGIDNENIIPAFHGTGGIGASMILRFGFRVITDDKMVSGKALGDGIYFTNKIDKACQYVGNGGHTRRRGTKGYIFQMESQLGKRRQHYEAAGLNDGNDRYNFISPEWCVFEPNHQLKIMTAYEVELGTLDDYNETQKKSGLSEGIQSFSEFMINEKVKEKPEEQIRFVFYNNQILLDDRKIYWADEIESYGNNVRIERVVDGTAITFLNTKTTETYEIAFAAKIKPSTAKKYFTLLNMYKRKSGLRLKKK
jgi:hypothetical protein